VIPISYKGDEISRLSRLFSRSVAEQTTDAATETEGSRPVSVRAYM